MGLQNLVTRGLPDPVEVEDRTVFEQLWTSPLLLPVRLFWNTLLDFRPWWPVLLPALLLLGLRVYRRERQEYVMELTLREAERAAREQNTQRT